MKRWIGLLTIATMLVGSIGCSMCCGPYDYDYPTFGGKHQRVNPSYGRVGSIFSDPLASFGDASADSNLKAPPEPRSSTIDDDDLDLDQRLRDEIDNDDELQRELDDLKNLKDIDDLEGIDPMESTLPGEDAEAEKTTSTQNRLRGVQSSWR